MNLCCLTETESPPEIGATALHEAGHAVADVIFGWELTEVTIKKNCKTHRYGHCNAEPKDGKEYTWQNRAIVFLAGPLSEAWYNGSVNRVGMSDDAEKVENCIKGILSEAGRWEEGPSDEKVKHIPSYIAGAIIYEGSTAYPEEANLLEEYGQARKAYSERMKPKKDSVRESLCKSAMEFVNWHEPAIRAVAGALLAEDDVTGQRKETLTGNEVEEIVFSKGFQTGVCD